MSLSVHLFIKADTLFVRLTGELDHHTSNELRDRLNVLLVEYPIKNMIFNLKNLNFMDSSGVGLMLGRYNQIKKFKGVLAVCELNNTIEKMIKETGLYRILVITKDEAQASNLLGVA